jgi:hypothetical protein
VSADLTTMLAPTSSGTVRCNKTQLVARRGDRGHTAVGRLPGAAGGRHTLGNWRSPASASGPWA